MTINFRGRLTLLFGTVLLVFGVVADHRARDELRHELGLKLERRGVAIARDLAAAASDALAIGDEFGLSQLLARTRSHNVDTRYIVLIDGQGRIRASTFGSQIPAGLVAANRVPAGQPWSVRRLSTEEGLIRDVAVPVHAPSATVRVGMSDESLEIALSGYSRTLSLTLIAIMVAGLFVSYGLAGVLVRPLNQLIAAVRSVERGNLTETIPSPGRDEVGQLAAEFNNMTRSLAEKEALRQALLEKVITSQEEERRRVARDLHDDLAQVLTYVLLKLEALDTRLVGIDAESRAALGQARQALGVSLAETRRLITDLRPTVLDDLGLVAALRSYAESHLRPIGCRIEFDAAGVPDGLPPFVETAVFRIVQEAINNIVRHAGASSARIALRTSNGSLIGEVADDGCGYLSAPQLGKESELSGLGVQGMRERASLLGGALRIREPRQGGTQVTFDVPLGTGRT